MIAVRLGGFNPCQRSRIRSGTVVLDGGDEARGFVCCAGKWRAVFAGEEACAGGGGHGVWRLYQHAGADFCGLGLPRAGKGDLGGFAGTVGTEELLTCARIIKEQRGAFVGAQQGL